MNGGRLAASGRVFHRHVLQAQNVIVTEQLQQLDFPERRDGKLRFVSDVSPVSSARLQRLLTPSFSLCMIIFFRATKAPVFFDLARWTSLAAASAKVVPKMPH